MPTIEPAPHRPKVSVVIPCYSCEKTISQVIDALLAQTFTPHEIIIVNDYSPDNLHDAIAPYLDRVRYIRHDRNRGLAASYNDGLRMAGGDFLMTVHSDCILDPQYIETLLNHLLLDPTIAAATGQYLFDQFDQMKLSDRIFSVINHIPIEEDRNEKALHDIAFIEGKADIFRRVPLELAGFFNQHLALTAEDQDLSVKLRRQGCRIVQDSSCRFRVVFSGTSDSLRKVLRKQRTYARGQAYVVWRYRGDCFIKSTANRNRRALHRLFQLAFASSFLIAVLASLVMYQFWFVVAILLMGRAFIYFSYAKRLGIWQRMLTAPIGVAADMLYFSGAIEGIIKTTLFKKT